MSAPLTEQIEALILQPIAEIAAELVEFQVKHRGKTVIIDIVADRPGGITIGECAYINKKVDRAIERQQWFNGDYAVEVSSPGLDRVLKTPRDFTRAIGSLVRFHLFKPVEEKVEHVGEITKVENNQILIKKNDRIITVLLEDISKAVRVIEDEE
jgi:ribosome maturation factor RimP